MVVAEVFRKFVGNDHSHAYRIADESARANRNGVRYADPVLLAIWSEGEIGRSLATQSRNKDIDDLPPELIADSDAHSGYCDDAGNCDKKNDECVFDEPLTLNGILVRRPELNDTLHQELRNHSLCAFEKIHKRGMCEHMPVCRCDHLSNRPEFPKVRSFP